MCGEFGDLLIDLLRSELDRARCAGIVLGPLNFRRLIRESEESIRSLWSSGYTEAVSGDGLLESIELAAVISFFLTYHLTLGYSTALWGSP